MRKSPEPKTLEFSSVRGSKTWYWRMSIRYVSEGCIYIYQEELPVGADFGSHSSWGDQSSPRGNATGAFYKCLCCTYTRSEINIELQHRDSYNNVTRTKYLKKWKLSSLQTMAILWLVGFNHWFFALLIWQYWTWVTAVFRSDKYVEKSTLMKIHQKIRECFKVTWVCAGGFWNEGIKARTDSGVLFPCCSLAHTIHFDRDPQKWRSNLPFVELPYVGNFLFKLTESFVTGQTWKNRKKPTTVDKIVWLNSFCIWNSWLKNHVYLNKSFSYPHLTSNLKNKRLISRQGRMCALFNFINLTRSEAKDFSGMKVILYLLLPDPKT